MSAIFKEPYRHVYPSIHMVACINFYKIFCISFGNRVEELEKKVSTK